MTAVLTDAPVPTSLTTSAARLRFRGLGRSFGTHEVLRDIDLTVEPGELVAILGASGSGKSTLLRIAAGLDRASAGDVLIDDKPVITGSMNPTWEHVVFGEYTYNQTSAAPHRLTAWTPGAIEALEELFA